MAESTTCPPALRPAVHPGRRDLHPGPSNDRSPLFVDVFYLALALIIMGVGYLKPNISSIVGQLYLPGDRAS